MNRRRALIFGAPVPDGTVRVRCPFWPPRRTRMGAAGPRRSGAAYVLACIGMYWPVSARIMVRIETLSACGRRARAVGDRAWPRTALWILQSKSGRGSARLRRSHGRRPRRFRRTPRGEAPQRLRGVGLQYASMYRSRQLSLDTHYRYTLQHAMRAPVGRLVQHRLHANSSVPLEPLACIWHESKQHYVLFQGFKLCWV